MDNIKMSDKQKNAQPIISQEEYLTNSCQCPFCKSKNIEAISSMDMDGNEAWQEIKCIDCEIVWEDTYNLVSFVKSTNY